MLIVLLFTMLLASPTWAAEFAVTQCALPTTNGGTVDCTSAGFGTPQGAFLFGGFGVTNNVVAAHSGMFFGVYDGTRQQSIGGAAQDGVNPTSTSAFRDGSSVYGTQNVTTKTRDGVCTASTITNGIRLTCNPAPASAYLVNVLLIGGAGVANVYAGSATSSSTNNAVVSVTDPGFQPDLILAFMHNSNTGLMHTSVGMAWRNGALIGQRGMGVYNDNARTTSAVYSMLSDQYMLQSGLSSTTSLEVTAFGTLGFDITTRVTGGARIFSYLAIKLNCLDVYAAMSTAAAPTATGTSAVTGVGFVPQVGIMLAGQHAALNTQYTGTTGEVYGISVFTPTASVTSSIWSGGVLSTSGQESVTDGKACRTRKGRADYDTCAVSSYDVDGVTFNYTVASASTRQRALLFLSTNTSPQGRRSLPKIFP